MTEPPPVVHAAREGAALALCGTERGAVVPLEELAAITCLPCRLIAKVTRGTRQAAAETARRQDLRDELNAAWAHYHEERDIERAVRELVRQRKGTR